MLEGSSILVTGGSGSFGRAFTRYVLKLKPKRVVIYSRGEHLQESMEQELNNEALRFFIGDIRDQQRLEMAMRGVDYVIHAAAMKVVPKCEYDPIEAVRTNIIGAENVIRSTLKSGVKKVVALSTDKACSPVNLYGATKLAAEKLFMAARNLRGQDPTIFSVCRYGNVFGSQGSVVPLFQRLAADGKPFPITDPAMTRFIITMPQAVDFVIKAMATMQGSEIFVPRIPSAYVTDIAKAIDPDLPHVIVGIRPGEKLHETLITEDEEHHTNVTKEGWVIQHNRLSGSVDRWSYNSRDNTEWLSVNDLRQMM